MPSRHRLLEAAVQGLIVFSIVDHFLELQFDPDHVSPVFLAIERVVATLFTLEYVCRWAASRQWSYPLQPMAIVDLLAILPFYLGFLVDLRTLRMIRLLRVLRLFKLYRYNHALESIVSAFLRVRYEFGVVGFAVLLVLWCSSVAMYEMERDAQPQVFAKLTDAIWFVLTTLTTVGYGDKVPITVGGKLIAGSLMITGLGLFGTFVSLIGSAFLEEIRRRHVPQSDESSTQVHPTLLAALEPTQVLALLNQGALVDAAGTPKPETLALLKYACERLQAKPHRLAS
jgi:voltage-gated potassium channel